LFHVALIATVQQFELIHGDIFVPAPLHKLRWPAILGAMGLGFSLSLLFFMDQSISGAMVNSSENRLVSRTFKRRNINGVFLEA